MLKETVDKMLKEYRFCTGRCSFLENEIGMLEKQIEHEMSHRAEYLSEVKVQEISDMPHGTAISKPTERVGIMLASDWMPDEVKEMKQKVNEKKKEADRLYETVIFVQAWLSGLPDRYKWIIEHQVMDGECWHDVILRYKRDFGEELSKDSLKRLRGKALDYIYKMAE